MGAQASQRISTLLASLLFFSCTCTAMVVAARLAIVLLSSAFALPVRFRPEDCGSSHGRFQQMTTQPLKPHTGRKIHVMNKYNFDEPINDGTFVVTVTGLGVLPLKRQTGPMCGRDTTFGVHLGLMKVAEVTFKGLNCLLPRQGEVEVHYTIRLARILPPAFGDATFKVAIAGQSGQQATCLKVGIHVNLAESSEINATNNTLGNSNQALVGKSSDDTAPESFMPPWLPVAGMAFLEGFLGSTNIDVDSCLVGLMGPASDVKIGIDDITSGIKVRNITEIGEGVRSLGQFLEDVSPALEKCKVAKEDALAIIKVLKGFHSLEDVVSHIKADFADDDQAKKIAADFEL